MLLCITLTSVDNGKIGALDDSFPLCIHLCVFTHEEDVGADTKQWNVKKVILSLTWLNGKEEGTQTVLNEPEDVVCVPLEVEALCVSPGAV